MSQPTDPTRPTLERRNLPDVQRCGRCLLMPSTSFVEFSAVESLLAEHERLKELYAAAQDALVDATADRQAAESRLRTLEQGIRKKARIYEGDGLFGVACELRALVPTDGEPTPAPKKAPEHWCGLTGYNPMKGDTCPACDGEKE
jgi:hypothetical protein